MAQITQIFMTAVLLVLTFWRKDIVLYIIMFPLMIVNGLAWYDTHHSGPGFYMALTLIFIGIYCLVLGVYNMVKGKAGNN
jgi:hypothetical protein